jgi:hypothetical protein
MRTMLRSKITLLFMMLGLLVAVPTVAFAAQTRSVPANQDLPGFATGINIHEGDRVVITADGLVDLDCNTPPPSLDNIPPDGIDGSPQALSMQTQTTVPFLEVLVNSLIPTVGS